MKASRAVKITHNHLLRDPDVAAEYLNFALEEGNPNVILMAVRNIAEAQFEGIAGLAEKND